MTDIPAFHLATGPVDDKAALELRDGISKAINDWSPRDVNGTYQVDGSTLISVLGSIMCQFLASVPDRRMRRIAIRDVTREIERGVPRFIAAGVTMATTMTLIDKPSDEQ